MVCSAETASHWQPPLLTDRLNQAQVPAHDDETLQIPRDSAIAHDLDWQDPNAV